MTDPVLFLHRVDGTQDVYDTGSPQSPASIRDQILRASLLVARANDDKRIGPKAPLLVVGGGAAGVAAALRATALSVPVHLVSADEEYFERQRACTTRWIDPSVYEWPASHHSDPRWGVPPDIQLPYAPRIASDIVRTDWLPRLQPPSFTFYPKCVVRDVPRPVATGLAAEVENLGTGSKTPLIVAACIWAGGPGEEITAAGTYRGYRFWDNDPYGGALPTDCRALIVGGGDGAIQDLFRVLFDPGTVRTPRDLLPLVQRLDPSALRRIQTAEEQATRRALWNGGPRERTTDHPVFAKLHDVHRREAVALARDTAVRTFVRSRLRSPAPRVTFAHPCTHFTRCFGLNRFGALLLLEVLGSDIDHRPGTGVVEVGPTGPERAVGHTCGHPDNCHGRQHEAVLEGRACDGRDGRRRTFGPFNVVVVRLGLDPPSLPRPGTLRVRRHVLPYELA